MKTGKTNKIVHRNGKTIAIVNDPDGNIARLLADQLFYNEKMEKAKAALKECPVPDYILKRLKAKQALKCKKEIS